ncbi:MAG: DinB family protein [Nocardioidaceae bacterium]|nr:DinB family protein [Nocardioidaceae bacterium]
MDGDPREFRGRDLRGARFVESDLSGAVMRGVLVQGMDIEAPWLVEAGGLTVNGVDVVAFVDAELDRRFPGRELRGSTTPQGLRRAWAALERTWVGTLDRVEAMPAGTVDARVAGEWSFAQTLRHLVMATDMWLGRGVLRLERPFHPLGLADHSMAEDGEDMSVFSTATPTYAQVLSARAERVAMVRDYLCDVTEEVLAEERPNPHDPAFAETVGQCLGTILEEEWEHHRYAVRDLDALGSPH